MTAFKECEAMRANMTDSNIIFLNRFVNNIVIINVARVLDRGKKCAFASAKTMGIYLSAQV